MKKRITITLDESVLRQVDSLIDKKTIRNRSHAIETLVQENLGYSVKKAIILAGGRKNKKCVSLRNVNGRTLLHYQIEHLKSYGITSIVVCSGRFEDDIENIFGSGEELGVSISYLSEEKVFGTSGAVKKAKKYVGSHRFLVLHGDVLTNFDLTRFMEFHKTEGCIATIAVKPRLAEKRFGKVMMTGNKITEFVGDEGDRGISIVNAGVYIFEPEIFSLLPGKIPSYFEKNVFPSLARQRKLSAYIFQGKWYEVSGYKYYLEAKKEWKKS